MVQRYNPDYVMHAARFAPFARENEHGEFVKFSDYEILKAERDAQQKRVDALAVENAALKKSLIAISLAEPIDGETIVCDFDTLVSIAASALTTPFTGAELAAIQAQGVEKFADFLDSPIDGQHCYQNEVGLARHFASTLREAK
ncbi:hypothetical protein RGO66_000518 [Serratia marcescens]